MTDNDKHSNGKERAEPMLATDRLRTERRDQRKHVRVELPFEAQIDGKTYVGRDVSLNGFGIDKALSFHEGDNVHAELIFKFKGFTVNLPVTAKASGTGTTGRTGFEITSIEDDELEVLRKLITAHLSGTLVSIDGLLVSTDGQVARKAKKTGHAHSAKNRKRGSGLGTLVRWGAVASVAVALLLLAGTSFYERLFVVDSPFAATTAPRVDMRASGSGRFKDMGIVPGDRVKADEKIGRIINDELVSELAIAQATFQYQKQLISKLREAREQGGDAAAEAIAASLSNSNRSGSSGKRDVATLLTIEKRIEQLVSKKNLQRARIAALNQQDKGNTIYSPCDCIVHWARGGAGGTWVHNGDKLYELIPASPDKVMVEAQIPMSEVREIKRFQKANIELPNREQTITGRVVEVKLEGEHRPRAGFPKWVRQDLSKATVLIAPEKKIAQVGVGTPVDVSFSGTPQSLRTIHNTVTEVASSLVDQVLTDDSAQAARGDLPEKPQPQN
ncbi:HlyD family efflux transporter periplasmic adaptor subunit [Rhodovibrio salinarum]|uniref:HlyD family secretion protein n=1 Tax=Rhodovibrio salinarum TaxID=1087 RepID=A0A934UZ94_9PROT|nr:HlyD family secretion protein [Rhodovibrio salinarum]MBK1696160.1 HlyD family secretion protein [Rhodovibrio salinarum]